MLSGYLLSPHYYCQTNVSWLGNSTKGLHNTGASKLLECDVREISAGKSVLVKQCIKTFCWVTNEELFVNHHILLFTLRIGTSALMKDHNCFCFVCVTTHLHCFMFLVTHTRQAEGLVSPSATHNDTSKWKICVFALCYCHNVVVFCVNVYIDDAAMLL